MRETHESALGRTMRALWVAVVIAVGGPSLVASLVRPPGVEAQSYWREAGTVAVHVTDAEAAGLADRVRRQFRSTLDFGPLVDRFFVADAGQRNLREGPTGEWLEAHGARRAVLEQLDEAASRRAFVAYLNLTHLHAAHVLGTHRLAEVADATAIDVATAPDEAARAMAASRFYGGGLRIDSNDDVAAFLADTEAVCAAYRRALAARPGDTPIAAANREAVAAGERIVYTTRADRDSGYLEFGVPEGSAVREVRRDGLLWYSVVRESGSPRIVTVAFSEE
jgi:glyoxylase-like metal-dependent hydrolase (beta-lactamase superfamily II)